MPLSTIFQFYRGGIFGSKATRFFLYSHNKQVIALYMSNSRVTGTGLYSHNKQVIALYMSNSRVTGTGLYSHNKQVIALCMSNILVVLLALVGFVVFYCTLII
jgi:hypothetical protein